MMDAMTSEVNYDAIAGVLENAVPRAQGDLDVAVCATDLASAEEALARAGWARQGELRLVGGLKGSGWSKDRHELDSSDSPVRGVRRRSRRPRVMQQRGDRRSRWRTWLWRRLIASRTIDIADVSRMLGAAGDADLAEVRAAVAENLPGAGDDLERLIVLGRLEYESPADDQ